MSLNPKLAISATSSFSVRQFKINRFKCWICMRNTLQTVTGLIYTSQKFYTKKQITCYLRISLSQSDLFPKPSSRLLTPINPSVRLKKRRKLGCFYGTPANMRKVIKSYQHSQKRLLTKRLGLRIGRQSVNHWAS